MRRPLQSGWRTGTEKVGPWNTAAWKGRRVESEVAGAVNYIADMSQRPRFHVNDTTRDVLQLDPRTVSIEDARSRKTAPSIDREGFALAAHESAVADFRDPQAVARTHYPEIERLLLCVSGADQVVVTSPGVLRFSEHSLRLRAPRQLPPARFIHIDISDATARVFSARSQPKEVQRPVLRCVHFNVWRVLSTPPQDVPLAVCEARTVSARDLVEADAVFDVPGPTSSFSTP